MSLFQGSTRRIAALQAIVILVLLFVPAAAITMVPFGLNRETSVSQPAPNKVTLLHHRNGFTISDWASTEPVVWDWLNDGPIGLTNIVSQSALRDRLSETQIPGPPVSNDRQRIKEPQDHYEIFASAKGREHFLRPGQKKLRVFLLLAALCRVGRHKR